MNDDGTLAKQTADFTLGKPASHARRTAAGEWHEAQTEFPGSLVVDHTNMRLFVADSSTGQGIAGAGSQIMVFDIHPDRIATGASVIAILGQPDADTKVVGLGANHVGRRLGLAVDDVHQRLFVSDGANNRVLVFDTREGALRTGMDASIVLGQEDFTSRESGLAQNRFSRPGGVAYDANNDRLFVSDSGNSRVLVFDAAPETLENGPAAIDVMGQPDFTTNRRRVGLDGFATGGITYDDKTDRLFIAEQVPRIEHMRVVVYDVAPGVPLRDARPMAVLGKPGFGAYDPIVSRSESVWPRLGAASIDPDRQILVATEGYPGGNRAIIWDVSPETLVNGMPAVEVVGHMDDDGHTDFDARSANDRATPRNIYPRDVALDSLDHRLFAIDQYNNRALGWQLNDQNRVRDRDATWVFGQPSLYTGALHPIGPTTVKIPIAIAYDAHHRRVFIADGWGNRVMVFDARPGSQQLGPAAIAVIGQSDFVTTDAAVTQDGINLDTRVGTGITPGSPRTAALTYDPVNDRLFLSDGGNNRILVYDVAPDKLRNGMPASLVLGQRDFVSNVRGGGPSGLAQPAALHYEASHHRLFATDRNNRVIVFDARPSVLANGAAASWIIGQPDFETTDPGRSRSKVSGPDGLAYDTIKDRLFVSDHGNDRVLVFDAHPDRLVNGPEAQFVFGQEDFSGRELGQVRADEVWDPRGLGFDSEHERLYVSQGFASNIMIHDMARASRTVTLAPGALRTYQSASAAIDVVVLRGHATATGSGALEGGAAVFAVTKTEFDELSQRESRVLISEAGVAAPPLVTSARVFVDRAPNRETYLRFANPGEAPVNFELELLSVSGTNGTPIETRTLGSHESVTVAVGQTLGGSGVGSIRASGDRPFALVATRVTTNDRGESVQVAVPVVYGELLSNQADFLTLPRVEVGADAETQIVLLNTAGARLEGVIKLFTFDGRVMPIANGSSEIALSVEPGGVFEWTSRRTDGHAVGFAVVSVSSGIPVGSTVIRRYRGETLVSEHSASGGNVREAWFPIDTYPSVVRHGQTEFRLTLTNGGSDTADVRLLFHDEDGTFVSRSFHILPPGNSLELTHVDLLDRGKVRGSLRVVSDSPIGMSAEQRTMNLRREAISTAMPSMTSLDGGEFVVFPGYTDGAEEATQLFLLGSRAGGTAILRFSGNDGEELLALLR